MLHCSILICVCVCVGGGRGTLWFLLYSVQLNEYFTVCATNMSTNLCFVQLYYTSNPNYDF